MSVWNRAARIAERDGGWVCHYCGCNLIPPDIPEDTPPYYQLVMIRSMPTAHNGNRWRTEEEYIDVLNLYAEGLLIHWKCRWLNSPGYRYPEVDHVVPRARGGSNGLSNLVLACRECNRNKGTKPYGEFVKELLDGES
ncbi:MAG TPA: HNH endonuclease domain-containing protein [Bellilinea sp.]|nr:HNH endonuclease domain-containing protein [Bellilinea sp.]